MSDKNTNCCKETIVHQLLKVQAQVTITPIIKSGRPSVRCINTEIRPGSNCAERRKVCYQRRRESDCSPGKCTFTVDQILCVEIPISIDLDVDVDSGIVCCGRPELGPCKHPHQEPDCADLSKKL